MMSPVELRRILAEWRLRVQRVRDILQPPSWSELEWRQFSQALALLVREHGVYWDLRWKLQDGGELVCQVEHVPGERTSLVVAQSGGFVVDVESYTWLWAEFNMEGEFSREPYWIDGTWKDALTALLLPLERRSSYMLAGRQHTPQALLLQEGARPNTGQYSLPLPNAYLESHETNGNSLSTEEPPPADPISPEPPAEISTNGHPPAAAETVSEPEFSPTDNSAAETLPAEAPTPPPTDPPSEPVQEENPISAPTPVKLPSKARDRYHRQRAKLRFSRSQRPLQPRSYYR
jgi:hypothetical protein